ncbi:hypothetical protein [Streptomyces chattanoogensis]|uniref:hypothetical protein n=1 Tax=Streptomyces chattanoogensis TaxID=66876 RepID=UPI00367E3675
MEPEPGAPAFGIGGDGSAPGPQCGKAFRGDPEAVTGRGSKFWNWDALRPGFVAELTRRLGGHRTVELEGKP